MIETAFANNGCNSKVFNFYIDDTGTKELEDKNTNFFAYAGIIVQQNDETNIIKNILNLVLDFFPEQVELKSNWFRIPKERKKHYLEPFNLSDEKFKNFTDKLYLKILQFPLHCLGVIVDKTKIEEKYRNPFPPSAICYELLLQHIANYNSQYNGSIVNIFVDDMSGKNCNGSEWKNLLIAQHKNLKSGKSPFYKHWSKRKKMNYDKISNELEFLDSKKSILIQIADICAYNIMRQAREYWNNFDNPPYYTGYEWIKTKMHRDTRSNIINHYGALCFPNDK